MTGDGTGWRVLCTDYAWPSLEVERKVVAEVGAELVVAETGEEAELLRHAPEVDAILTCWRTVSVDVVEAATRCRIIARYGIGLDNIAVEQATRYGIVVTNVPDYCLEEVSDHVLALVLACARRLLPYVEMTREGRWQQQVASPPMRLRGRTLGLIGHGNIARALIPKVTCLGLQVLVYTPRLSPRELAPQVTATDRLQELLRQADFLSIHAPLTDETYHLIDAGALRQMKPSAYLINSARGAIVDEDALRHALLEGRIAGAALDVLADEPMAPGHPLRGLDNVLITPHVAFYSDASVRELAEKAATRVVEALQGRVPEHVVNPEVLGRDNLRI